MVIPTPSATGDRNMPMKLNKPPVIETWIDFKFEPNPSKREWTESIAESFLSKYRDDLVVQDAIYSQTYRVVPIDEPRGRPKVEMADQGLDRMRARDAAGVRCLQIADDQLVFNIVRHDSALDYGSLRDEAILKLADYISFFKPEVVKHAELCYVDVIAIPKPPDGSPIKLEEFFNMRLELPPEFGTSHYFAIRTWLDVPGSKDLLEAKVESVTAPVESGVFQFRADWRYVCQDLRTIDLRVIRDRLDEAHDCILHRFKASVTKATWELFEPEIDYGLRSSTPIELDLGGD